MTVVVSAEKLTKTFGSHRGIVGVDFMVTDGEIFGFLGPNGAGKSTTIRLLTGLSHPTSGAVTVFGLDPVPAAVDVHRRIGYLPGELALHPRLSGRHHVDFAAKVRGMRDRTFIDELVARFQVDLERPTRTLSKGNRQKIGIVLAVMHRPELVILDEPTSGLDPLMQDEFERLMRELVSTGATIFLSSHELDEVQRVATRVAIIRDGHLVVTDTVEALRRRAPRTIEFSFPRTVDPKPFASIEGVQVVAANGTRITLALRGAVAPVLRVAAELGPLDMVARPADLDELFRTYYRDQSADEPDDAR
ncbi:MAG TPA: ABC transporter ATP-binding protein [Candidatus Acidoferrales bacterium]|nr:ABC transporter ATP-binding protein [Candidatus Acidoferrales bacterium]